MQKLYAIWRSGGGISFQTEMTAHAIIIEPDRLQELVRQLKQGENVVDELARGHIKLAISIAARYGRFAPNKVHDILAEALRGMCCAIDKARTGLTDDNITAWIASYMHRFCFKFIRKDKMVGASATTETRQGENAVRWKRVPMPDSVSARDYQRLRELREQLELIVKDDHDREIIQLREEGYRNCEIAEKLGVSEAYICKKRKRLERRFQELEQ